MTKLSVNINKVATLRNARGGNNPDVEKVALDCESFGAEGITVHPRPDERHIRILMFWRCALFCIPNLISKAIHQESSSTWRLRLSRIRLRWCPMLRDKSHRMLDGIPKTIFRSLQS